MLEPILDLFSYEGAPFMSSFKNSTPWVKKGQEFVAGDLMKQKNIKVVDEYKTFVAVSGEFSHAKPKIQADVADPNVTDILSFSHSAYNFRTIP